MKAADGFVLTQWFCFREQRVTGFIVFILTGISVFMAPILKVRTSAFVVFCFLLLTRPT